jgi:hypothetical protein
MRGWQGEGLGRVGGKGGHGGRGGEMTQALYAHMNIKTIKNFFKKMLNRAADFHSKVNFHETLIRCYFFLSSCNW